MEIISVEWRRSARPDPERDPVASAVRVSVRDTDEARRVYRVLEGILLALTSNGRFTLRREGTTPLPGE